MVLSRKVTYDGHLLLHLAQSPQQDEPFFFAADSKDNGTGDNSRNYCDKNDINRSPCECCEGDHKRPPVHKRMMNLNRKQTIQARMHCQMTTAAAHFQPSSRLIDAIAATQGV